MIVFGVATCNVDFTNTALPGAFGGAAIAPYWDDFFQPSGNVYWAVQGVAPNRTAIIEWDRAHYNSGAETSGRAKVEAILGENGSISFQYQTTAFGTPTTFDHGVTATIGLQNADNSLVNQYSFDVALPHERGGAGRGPGRGGRRFPLVQGLLARDHRLPRGAARCPLPGRPLLCKTDTAPAWRNTWSSVAHTDPRWSNPDPPRANSAPRRTSSAPRRRNTCSSGEQY